MSPFLRKGVLVLVLLVAASLITATYRPLSSPVGGDQLRLFPQAVGEWLSLRDVEVSGVVWSALDPKALIFREYRHPALTPGARAWLVIVYHENDRWGAHDPQVCWLSQGWRIDKLGEEETVRVALPNGKGYVNMFVVGKGSERRIVLYWWFTSGKRQMPDRFSHMVSMIWNGILRGYTESGFVRVDGPVVGGDEGATLRTLLAFAGEVAHRLNDFIP